MPQQYQQPAATQLVIFTIAHWQPARFLGPRARGMMALKPGRRPANPTHFAKNTDMSEAYQYDDGCRLLIFRYGDEECRALSAHYSGIRFNQVRLTFLPLRALQDGPDREEIEMTFNISGRPFDLTRHGFAHSSWWRMVPPSGITHRCNTEGFGRAWRNVRTRTGYRLQGAQYTDGMTKLTVALKPIFQARADTPLKFAAPRP
jgi:hypothetical protein